MEGWATRLELYSTVLPLTNYPAGSKSLRNSVWDKYRPTEGSQTSNPPVPQGVLISAGLFANAAEMAVEGVEAWGLNEGSSHATKE